MKKILKNTLAAILLAGIAIHATAAAQSKYEILRKQVATEVMQEMQASGTPPDEAEMSQRVIAKLRVRLDEYNEAMKEDCIQDYGEANQKQCQCIINEVDYGAYLSDLERGLNADPQIRMEELQKAERMREDLETTAIKFCGLRISRNWEITDVPSQVEPLNQKILDEIIQEVQAAKVSGNKLTDEQWIKKISDKLHGRMDDYKRANQEDCINIFGSDKKRECQCFADKNNYEAQFSLYIKIMEVNTQEEVTKAQQAWQKSVQNVVKACGLSASIAKAKKQK